MKPEMKSIFKGAQKETHKTVIQKSNIFIFTFYDAVLNLECGCYSNSLTSNTCTYMAELLQHLLAVGQVRSHKLGSVHLDLLSDSPGGQARLEG